MYNVAAMAGRSGRGPRVLCGLTRARGRRPRPLTRAGSATPADTASAARTRPARQLYQIIRKFLPQASL